MPIERDIERGHMSVAIPAFRAMLWEGRQAGNDPAGYAVIRGTTTWDDLFHDLDEREARGERYIATGCPTPAADGSCPGH